ncbi:hypothetical protein [Brevundimonas sp. SORGH_AS_0993]|uniref:hypothetical protein n=1 Tax=Brevundimonas sp. SORGH_AS_0993 TaxID=3041794 RepID=UPI002784810B|nr:hypothetical protein [Brevundimonas sp. SORGH_AS_0993]MDQ1154433.1 hypothetical protein [Brevundimonas sp. SORGH_AS_0993]
MSNVTNVSTGPSAASLGSAGATERGDVDPKFKAIIDTLNDESGAVSVADKAAALAEYRKTSKNLFTANQATKDYATKGISSSSFLSQSTSLRHEVFEMSYSSSVDDARPSSERLQALLNAFDRLSEDEKIMFASAGSSTPEVWRAKTEAMMKMQKGLEDARASGELGFDGKPTGKASAALQLLLEAADSFDKVNQGDPEAVKAWAERFNDQMSAADRSSAYRIDLSDEAKAYMNRQ